MRYAIVIENAGPNFSAYVPDLPGCVATGATIDEVQREMREAIELHIEGMREDGEPIPQPSVAETRRFLELPPDIPRATAIAATGDAIWALVEDPRTSKTQPMVRVKLHRLPVGSFPVPPGED